MFVAPVCLVLIAAAAAPTRTRPVSAAEVAQRGRELAGDDEVAAAAARRLGDAGAAAVPPLVEALSMGTVPKVAAEACASLGKIGDPRGTPVLLLYAGNRNPPVRAAAVAALGRTRDRDERIAATLSERLGDADASVRAAAAEALAARRETRAVPRLLALLARNDAGVAEPLGALIPPGDGTRLTALAGQVDEGVLASALGAFVQRRDVPDPVRVDVVRAIGRLGGPAATTALVEYLATVPDGERRPSGDEAQKALDARGSQP